MEILEIITIGLPFCIFKIETGLYLNQPILVILGIIDSFINLTNLGTQLLMKKRFFDACFFSWLVRLIRKPHSEVKPKWQDFGNALDVFISFLLVAYMVGGSFLKELPSNQLQIWNWSVVLNVIGAGIGRMNSSIQNLKTK